MKPGERGLKKGPVCGADVGRIKERSDADPASAHTKRQPPSPNPLPPIPSKSNLDETGGEGAKKGTSVRSRCRPDQGAQRRGSGKRPHQASAPLTQRR
ncbi:hypothetical protein K227x_03830 [Rubripirellula lacrimiformis]|uniref:Uncharacterized protein n=1 Tax=Rubripirellula lacrimiformis TaxID=1930273 RepID=A0A517N4F8_9BACT|nr:hypothetical protein K227x_03830 [Rubripirellula lacrimiformis]